MHRLFAGRGIKRLDTGKLVPLLLVILVLSQSATPSLALAKKSSPAVKTESKAKPAKKAKSKVKAENNDDVIIERLPRTVMPETYRLFIEPDLEHKQFSGEETIFLNVTDATKTVILNAIDLDISEPEISLKSDGDGHGKWIEATKIEKDKEHELVRLRFKNAIKPGKYELRLKFGGQINDKLAGLYYSTFKNDKGEKQILAVTQLEPTDARKVFPCFDEPDMKATFKITLSIDPALTAISNAPVQFDKVDGRSNKRQITFEETPKMSTYLVALIVGPFESTEPVQANGVDIRIWTVPGRTTQGLFARDAAAKMLPYLESYFGVKYPLKKLDLIAIPDFGPGAMENFGAITFREVRLLVDEKTASTQAKQDVASVVAHEMAHQWFGDLVTMKWWDDLWLNEAFATWMSVKVLEAYNADWHPWDLFVKDRAPALATDSLASTKPIYSKVPNPGEVEEMFDEITYDKGASVLRMLERYLGEETYMKGIQHYIREHQYGNAETRDLWQSLEAASGKPVAKIMQEWVYSPGYPVVTVSPEPKDQAMNLSQTRFSISQKGKEENSNQLWQIPITARFLEDGNDGYTIKVLLNDKSESVAALSFNKPVFLNAGADGYFRVHYPEKRMNELGSILQSKLTARERYQLLDDSWSMVEAGLEPIDSYLNLTAHYRDESDPNVMDLLVDQFATIDWYVKEQSRPQFAAFVRDRLGPLAQKLGWQAADGEPELMQMLRAHVLDAMGTFGQDGATIDEAKKLWKIYLDKPESLNPNLYDALVSIMAYNGDETVYADMERSFKQASTAEAMVRNLEGLAYFRKEPLQKRTLELMLTDEVKTQDAPHVILKLIETTEGREIGWRFVKEHWSEMQERYPVHIFPRIVSGAKSFVMQSQADDLEKFLATHPMKGGRRMAGKMIERVRSNVRIHQRSAENLNDWLKGFGVKTSAAVN